MTDANQKVSNDTQAMMAFEANKKSMLVAYLLWFFFGFLGVHRFYLGQTRSGAAMLIITCLSWLLTLAVIGFAGLLIILIWWFIDLFLTQGMVNDHNNALRKRIGAGVLE